MSSRSSFSERSERILSYICSTLLSPKLSISVHRKKTIQTHRQIDSGVTSPSGRLAVGGSVLQKPQAVLPVHCHPSNQQRRTRLQQGEGDGDQV